MRLRDVINIEDLHRAAVRRVPRAVFNYFEGGAEDERGLAENEEAYRRRRLLPRVLVDVTKVETGATLFGRRYAAPFGIAPTAAGGLLRRGADRMIAEAAAAADIPYTLAQVSNTPLEEIAQAAPQHAWFQLYGARERRIAEDMIRRADDAGMGALVFTVDVPMISKRERELRSRFGQFPLPLWAYVEALRHPGWLLELLLRGIPPFANFAPYAGDRPSKKHIIAVLRAQFPVADHTWRDVERFRTLWKRPFLVKGILHPQDAVRAAELGVDGVVVSNHGARQLDRAPTALDMLPAVKAALQDKAGGRVAVLVDGGVRRGADIVIARALGADFVLAGRPTQYGVAAYGRAGAARAIEILRQELMLTLQQIGCTDQAALGPEYLLAGVP
jgi:isopentenyl diphosphate isomerase/L-lactate dehydrogenase-like FMN-dependent dehydrogenase